MKDTILRIETQGALVHHNFTTRRLPVPVTQELSSNLEHALAILERERIEVQGKLRIVQNPLVEGAYSSPLKLFVDVSNYCNLTCDHCLSDSSRDGEDQLSLKSLIPIAKEAGEVGVLYAKLGGGEPLLHSEILGIIDTFNDNHVDVSLTTNGTVMPIELARALVQRQVKVSVSFDGTQETHNRIRGDGVYQKALRTVERLQREGVDFTLQATLFPFNFDDIPALVQLAEEYGAVLKVRRAKPSGRTIDNELCMVQPSAEYFSLLEYLNGLGDRVDIEDIMNFNCGYDSELLVGDRDCAAGTRSLHIDQYGNVSPCVFLGKDLRAGNIFKGGTIMSEWRRAHSFVVMRELEMSEPCYDCERVSKCHNECPAIKLYATGSLTGHDPACPRPYLTGEEMEHTEFRGRRRLRVVDQ